MKQTRIYQEFESLAEQLGIRLIIDKGNFTGGYCSIDDERIIVLNKNKPIEQRVKQFAIAFSKLDTTQFFIKPRLREIISQEVQ